MEKHKSGVIVKDLVLHVLKPFNRFLKTFLLIVSGKSKMNGGYIQTDVQNYVKCEINTSEPTKLSYYALRTSSTCVLKVLRVIC
jgi:hypothetical protein